MIDRVNYDEVPAVNKSTLWWMRKSPAHYKWALTEKTPDTPAMRFGRAVHMGFLESGAYKENYAVFFGDRRTKAGKDEYQALIDSGKEILTQEEAQTIAQMILAIPLRAWELVASTDAEREKALFWTDPESGVECKGRLDAVRPGFVIDYKTTADASTEAFTREAMKYGYDLQAAMYLTGAELNGYGKCDFYFIAQEKSAPYAVNIIRASEAFIDRGHWIMRDLLQKWKECNDAGKWPGYGENELIIPEWAVMDE